jgi:hypothetical protein
VQPALKKYKIGLAIIGLVSLGLFVFVLSQAAATKDDNKIYSRATNIGIDLTNYIADQGSVPSSLGLAGIMNVPSAVTYTQVSSTSFKFCVRYKTTSSDFNAANVETSLLTSSAGSDDDVDAGSGGSGNTVLDLSPEHHKGENCQTVSPDLFSQSESYNSESPDDSTYFN